MTRKQATSKIYGARASREADRLRTQVVSTFQIGKQQCMTSEDLESWLTYNVLGTEIYRRLPAIHAASVLGSIATMRQLLWRNDLRFARLIDGKIVISKQETPDQWARICNRENFLSGFVWNHDPTRWYTLD